MTRETRIAMLVGLLFIVLFGMVLSELTGTGPAPSPADAAIQRPRAYVFTPLPEPPRPSNRAESPGAAALERSGPVRSEQVGSPARAPEGQVHAELGRRGLVPAMARRREPRQTPPAPPVAPARRPAPLPAARIYTVQPNDSLIKIARKVYGPAHGREYRRIFEANRDRLTDEASIQVGQKLVIPPRAERPGTARLPEPRPAGSVGSALAAPTPGAARRSDSREVTMAELGARFGVGAERAEQAKPAPRDERVYVVRQGDSLTGIARKVLGDGSRQAVQRIYSVNRDRLSSPDVLPVGTKLRIPGRT